LTGEEKKSLFQKGGLAVQRKGGVLSKRRQGEDLSQKEREKAAST